MLMPIMISMTRSYHNSKIFRRFISVLSHTSTISFTTALFLILFFITSCERKPTIIGSDVLPGKDFVNIKSTDTIGVAAYTLYTDSVTTNSATYSFLGKLSDPYFGDTKTDFVSQLRLSAPWPGGGAFVVDSVLLTFSINGAKGKLDSTTIRQIKIFEISEMLNSDVKYYFDRDPNAGQEIGTFSLPVIPKDTVQAINIVLPTSFGEYLMRDTTKLEQNGDADDFRSFFQGIYITMVDPPSPFLVELNFSTSNLVITVYYHNSATSSLTYAFIINPNSIRYNRYIHNFTAADPLKKIKHVNDGVKDTMIYLQSFYGVFPQLKMPGLTYIKNTLLPVSVNKARLTFSVFLDSVNYSASTVPPQILMRYTVSDTIKNIVPDYTVSSSFFDGTYNTTANTYSFNLASFVQEYFKGHISAPVVEMYYPEGEYRNVILKANKSHFPVIFDFTYTKF
jgi:hypothetical protein